MMSNLRWLAELNSITTEAILCFFEFLLILTIWPIFTVGAPSGFQLWSPTSGKISSPACLHANVHSPL